MTGEQEPQPPVYTNTDIMDATGVLSNYAKADGTARKDCEIPNDKLELVILAILASREKLTAQKLLVLSSGYNQRCATPLPSNKLDELVVKVYTSYQKYLAEKRQKAIAVKAPDNVDNKYPDTMYVFTERTDDDGSIIRIATDIDHPAVCEYIKGRMFTISFNDTLYLYDDGIYREDADDVNKIVVDILYDRDIRKGERNTTADIIHALKGMNTVTKYPFDPVGLVIAVENGVVVIDIATRTVTLTENDPKYMLTYRLPVKYNKGADPATFLKVLREWVEEDDVRILLQIPSQAIIQYMRRKTYKRNYLVQGEPNAGKSTFLDLLIKFFGGDKGKSMVPLCDICGTNRFCNATMVGKLLNIVDDMEDVKLDTANRFKKFTGSVEHQIEVKGKQPYQGIITCPHVFSCNAPPLYDDALKYDPAFWNRMEFVSFPYQFDKVGTEFQDKTFTPEFMSCVLNAVLETCMTILINDELVVNHTPEEVMERWGMLSDPLKMWIGSRFAKGTQTTITTDYDKKGMWDDYSEFVETSKIAPKRRIQSPENFGRKLVGEGFLSTHIKMPNEKGKSEDVRVYRSHHVWLGDLKKVKPRLEQSGIINQFN
jgi:phage/plasmid-associated DNA primase